MYWETPPHKPVLTQDLYLLVLGDSTSQTCTHTGPIPTCTGRLHLTNLYSHRTYTYLYWETPPHKPVLTQDLYLLVLGDSTSQTCTHTGPIPTCTGRLHLTNLYSHRTYTYMYWETPPHKPALTQDLYLHVLGDSTSQTCTHAGPSSLQLLVVKIGFFWSQDIL